MIESSDEKHNERFLDTNIGTNYQRKLSENENRFNSPLGLNVPTTQIKGHHTNVSLFCIGLIANAEYSQCQYRNVLKREETHPKINSGWEKKSVILSKRLLGSSTKVGRAILDKSIPGRTGVHFVSISMYMQLQKEAYIER